jgi:hypothetical protein
VVSDIQTRHLVFIADSISGCDGTYHFHQDHSNHQRLDSGGEDTNDLDSQL